MHPYPSTYDFLYGLAQIGIICVGAMILAMVVVAFVQRDRDPERDQNQQ